MMTLILAGALIGFVLGLRFRALILVPVIFLAVVVIATFRMTHGYALGSTLAAITLPAIAVQLGYLGAAALRFLRATRIPPLPKERGPARPTPVHFSGSAR